MLKVFAHLILRQAPVEARVVENACVMAYFFYFLTAIFSFLATIACARAQAIETVSDLGLWRVSIEPLKSTYVGAFGRYIEPEIAAEWRTLFSGSQAGNSTGGGGSSAGGGGGSSAGGGAGSSVGGGSSGGLSFKGGIWKFILPDGRLPGDIDVSYAGTAGWHLSATFEPAAFKLWNGLSPQLLFGYFYDNNVLRACAPTGFGIFGDPARARAQAVFFGLNEEIRVPIYLLESEAVNYKFLIGQGWMWERSYTSASIKSASIDVYQAVNANRTTPTFSFTTEARRNEMASSWLDISPRLRFSGVDFSLYGLETEYMWTLAASASLVWRF